MREYIDREALLQDISETVLFTVRGTAELPTPEMRGANKVIDRIKASPAADVAEVRHGEWKWGYGVGGQYGIWCTNCGAGYVDSPNAEWIAQEHDYCGKCGAKMDGKDCDV